MTTKFAHLIYIFAFFFSIQTLKAQDLPWKLPTEPYFQQQVNNVINVTLDDSLHTLTGEIEMEYINNSPDVLNEIYLHLWGNAYKDRSTAFAEQRLRDGSTKFHYAKDEQRGNFSDLEIFVEGTAVPFAEWQGNRDIVKFALPFGLEPKKSTTIRIPFTLKIPISFSRLGHVGESYQLTQWFPKPAVYDRDGWHPMPYLHMGEFYSEFGNYEVNITLPDNYIVASTGTLQNDEEVQFINDKIEETKQLAADTTVNLDYPPSSDRMKTITFKAENVHDFGWFADKRFYVEKGEVTLNNGKIVDTWVFYTDTEKKLWQDALSYVDRSVKFYSDKVGNYPYPQATAVQSALSAGGGMEYPMITVIGTSGNAQALDAVITHEVGHNWFYGILGFNERDHTWLDEGINSYYDHRYTQEFYDSPMTMGLPKRFLKGMETSVMQTALIAQIKRGQDQRASLHANDFETTNYFFSCYEKPAVAFEFLEQYLGEEKFDRIMQKLYTEWEFKHPGPGDVIQHFNEEAGENLDWFFRGFIYSDDEMNYKLTSVKKEDEGYALKIKNKGQLTTPFPVTGYKDGKASHTEWYAAKESNEVVQFPGEDYDYFVIDSSFTMLDINLDNNFKKSKGVALPKIGFLTGLDDMEKKQIFINPALAINSYDGLMVGLNMHNLSIPLPKWKVNFNTMYGVGSRKIVGTGRIQYDQTVKKGWLEKITYKLSSRRFSYNTPTAENSRVYETIVPSIIFSLDHGNATLLNSAIELRNTWARWGDLPVQNANYTKLMYRGNYNSALNPFNFDVGAEYMAYSTFFAENVNSLKLDASFKQTFQYTEGKTINIRIYGGFFPLAADVNNTSVNANSVANNNINLVYNGEADHDFDDFFFGRSEQVGFEASQVVVKEGGFKLGGIVGNNLGQSDRAAFAVNLDAAIPGKFIPGSIRVYFDYGQYLISRQGNSAHEWETLASGGVMFRFLDVMNVYVPLYNNDLIIGSNDYSFLQRMTFTFDLNKLDVIDLYNNFRI